MNPLIHPFLVHLPMGISFILPFIVGAVILFWKKHGEIHSNWIWSFVTLPLGIMTVFTIAAVISGEAGIDYLKDFIHGDSLKDHESLAEMFAMIVYITTGLSLFIYMYKGTLRFQFMVGVFCLSLLLSIFSIFVGKKGGEIVYKDDAAQYLKNYSR